MNEGMSTCATIGIPRTWKDPDQDSVQHEFVNKSYNLPCLQYRNSDTNQIRRRLILRPLVACHQRLELCSDSLDKREEVTSLVELVN